MSDITASPASKQERKGPSFSSMSTSYFRSDGDHVNCCWCGHIIYGLKYEAKQNMNKAVRKYCPDCGKANVIQFHWTLIIESTPDTRQGT